MHSHTNSDTTKGPALRQQVQITRDQRAQPVRRRLSLSGGLRPQFVGVHPEPDQVAVLVVGQPLLQQGAVEFGMELQGQGGAGDERL